MVAPAFRARFHSSRPIDMALLLRYLSRHKGLIGLALLLAAINQVCSLLNPYILGNLIIDPYANRAPFFREQGLEGAFVRGVMTGLLMIVGVALLSRIAKAFQDYTVNVVAQRVGARLYTDGLRHALQLPYQDFEDQRSGETLSILQKVRVDCERFLLLFVNVLFTTVVGIAFIILVAAQLSALLPLIYLAGALALTLFSKALSARIEVIQRHIVQETSALAGATTESLRNVELIKSLGLTQQEIERLNTTTFRILRLELLKVRSVRIISFIQGTLVNLLQQCLMFALLWFLFRDRLTLGQLMMMNVYSFFVIGPLQDIGDVLLSYREAEASLRNFARLLAQPLERLPDDPRPVGAIVRLQFQQVRFQHRTALFAALEDISFEAGRGDTLAFVGPSGSGKTTLVKLLVGLYQPGAGRISYNDRPAREIDVEDLRRQIGIVTQETQLFAGTIKENLLFANPRASAAQLDEALRRAACGPLLARAAQGVDTRIGEGGLKLSGGERQRLSIARALLRQPTLLIFDEATSALDSLTEEAITDTIRGITAQRQHITITIAHRLSTIMHADRIHVLEKGRIIETGTHAALVREKGLYYAMWRQQIGERHVALASVSS